MFFLTAKEAGLLLAKMGTGKKVSISLDLGITEEEVELREDVVFIRGTVVGAGDLRKFKEGRIYFYDEGFYEAAISDRGRYKLVPTSGWPTLEINGVRMHRTKGTTPEEDAEAKVKSLGRVRGSVLDTNMGLGYTAIKSLEAGAEEVYTFEKDGWVFKLAKLNPYSRRLFEAGGRIKITLGAVEEHLPSFEDGYFHFIVHDPPRFALAGELYSLAFYRELFRVLRSGGALFHYVGTPGSRYRGKDLQKGVMERLRGAGFEAERVREALGVKAWK